MRQELMFSNFNMFSLALGNVRLTLQMSESDVVLGCDVGRKAGAVGAARGRSGGSGGSGGSEGR